jgi:pyruvate dehydrogenase E2 component (dihydrolipoamide acetyltransferase)
VPFRRAVALASLAVAAGARARWAAAATADPAATRRKVAIATWRPSREGRLMTRLVVDADPVLDYVAARRAEGAKGLTSMHVLGAAAARALIDVPTANARVLGGRLVAFDGVAVGFAVDIGRGTDLAPVKVDDAETLTPAQIATEVWRGVKALRAGTDEGFQRSARIAAAVPTALMRPLIATSSLVLGGLGLPLLGQRGHPLGAVFISNVAAFGVEEVFLAPVPFARAHIYISLGAVSERPVVRDGAVVAVRQFTLCMTGDHRIVDGVQCAVYFAAMLDLLAHPERLDRPADAHAPAART